MKIVYGAILSFLLDLLLGDPTWMPHPVVYMGKCIARLEKFLRKTLPDTGKGLLWGGRILAFCLPVGTLLSSGGAIWLLESCIPCWASCWGALGLAGAAIAGSQKGEQKRLSETHRRYHRKRPAGGSQNCRPGHPEPQSGGGDQSGGGNRGGELL